MTAVQQELTVHQRHFDKLVQQWGSFLRAIGQPMATTSDFTVFGKTFFVQFDHNLQDGFVSYGVTEPGEFRGQVREIVLLKFAFDIMGNVYELDENGEHGRFSNLSILNTDELKEFHCNNLLTMLEQLFPKPKVATAK